MNVQCKKCGSKRTPVKKGNGMRYRCRPCDAAYQRENYASNAEKMRDRKAAHMAKARRDPLTREKYLGYQRKAWRKGGSAKRKAWMQQLKVDEPWRWKALTVHTSIRGSLSGDDLRLLWLSQDGKCGLTGRPLEFDDMQLDHRLPRSRGGDNSLENLRWVCSVANQAKHGQTDEEFLVLCNQVAEWIGRRILEASQESTP